MNVACRFVCETVTLHPYGETVKFRAVDKTGGADDVSFSDATPSGTLEFFVSNKAVHGAFKPGVRYDLFISPVA